jgi:uncharacterized protein (DUF488 family)
VTARVATIGFTKTTARDFFERLSRAGVKKVFDVRLHNTSQLSGFAKADDLAYFLREISGIEYCHQPSLAPTDDLLKAYKKQGGTWRDYERQFLDLMEARAIEQDLTPEMLDGACLLCSEATPHHCHRRLVCDYLMSKWGPILSIQHL